MSRSCDKQLVKRLQEQYPIDYNERKRTEQEAQIVDQRLYSYYEDMRRIHEIRELGSVALGVLNIILLVICFYDIPN